MAQNARPPPTAFISYSWEGAQHREWVIALAADLRRDGVETTLDLWHTDLGDQLTHFMEREICNNDFVLIVCTPTYRRKSNQRAGGVGYEGNIMTADVAESGDHRKYIPILAQGSWSEAAPFWLKGKRYVDLQTSELYEANYRELLDALLGTGPVAPLVGGPDNGDAHANPSAPDFTAWGALEHISQKELSCLWDGLEVSDENFGEPAPQRRRAQLYDYGRKDFFFNPDKWLPEDVDRRIDAQRMADVVVQICERKGERVPRIVEEIRSHRYDGITAEQLVPDRSRDK